MINKNSKYFRQASAMLGEAEAERHLQVAAETTACDWLTKGPYENYRDHYVDTSSLLCQFVWSETVQGYEFWATIHEETLDTGE